MIMQRNASLGYQNSKNRLTIDHEAIFTEKMMNNTMSQDFIMYQYHYNLRRQIIIWPNMAWPWAQ